VLFIKDSAGHPTPNNRGSKWTKLRSIHVTEKAIYERLVLTSEWRSLAKCVTMLVAPTPSQLTSAQLLLDFLVFLEQWPQASTDFKKEIQASKMKFTWNLR